MSGFGRIVLLGALAATVAGIAGLQAQTQLADPKDAHRIFASTCSACHKSPQGLAKSGQVAGFLRQHYTTGPEMSAAMAAYLVAAGSGPASKKGQADAKAGQPADGAAKAKSKKQEAAVQSPADRADAKDRKDQRTLRGKQLEQAKSQDDRMTAHPSPASAADAAARQAATSAPHPAVAETPAAPAPVLEATPSPPVTLDIPLPEMPTAPPADLTQSVFASSPVP